MKSTVNPPEVESVALNGMALFSLAIRAQAGDCGSAAQGRVGVEEDAELPVEPAGDDQELGVVGPATAVGRAAVPEILARRRPGYGSVRRWK